MLEAIGARADIEHADAGARAPPAIVSTQVDHLRRQLLPFQSIRARSAGRRTRSRTTRSRTRLAGLAAMLAAGLPLHCVALDRARRVRHARRRGRRALRRRCSSPSDSLLAFQRDLEARGLADRVLTLVWSEFGRRAAGERRSGTDHGAAGFGFLIGTRVAGTMVGEFPGLRPGSTPTATSSPTADFRGVYARCSSSGSASTPRP